MSFLNFFTTSMQQAIEYKRAECLRAAEGHLHAADIRKMADTYKDFTPDNYPYAMMGSAAMDALAHALLTMPMTDWERFYRGYVTWSRKAPVCHYRGQEEANARGAMLMALKYHINSLKCQLARKAA